MQIRSGQFWEGKNRKVDFLGSTQLYHSLAWKQNIVFGVYYQKIEE